MALNRTQSDNLTIRTAGFEFRAYRCPTCGMRASDPATILVCESKHEQMARWLRGEEGLNYFGRKHKEKKPCSHSGCDHKAMARGYCSMHYMMQWQTS